MFPLGTQNITRYSLYLQILLLLIPRLIFAQQCEDDAYQECEERAKNGGCEGRGTSLPHYFARVMLSQCRRTCKEKYSDDPNLPAIISDYGGLEDTVEDAFGFKMPMCSHNGGFTSAGRELLLNLHAMNTKQLEWVPKFTKNGFSKDKIPTAIYNRIVQEYAAQQKNGLMVEEGCTPAIINCEMIVDEDSECSLQKSRRTFVTFPSQMTLDLLKETLHPLAEKWAGVKLKHSATYGIRRYTNGSWLTSHVDRFNTHVISAILNIGQKVDEDWPLYIQDNSGGNHEVTMEAGDLVWYESARAVHGRPAPMKGEYYDNLFIHYRPAGQWYEEPFQVGEKPRPKPYKLDDFRTPSTTSHRG